MKNVINLWKGLILRSEAEKQTLMLAKSLFTWGVSNTLLGICSMVELGFVTFPTLVFIFLQLFISLSSIGICEQTSIISIDKALEKSELIGNTFKVIVSILFYSVFFGIFPVHSVFISCFLCIWSYRVYKKKF